MQNIEKLLKTDVEKMWSEIKKSDQHKNLSYTEVFSVDVFPLSHFIYAHSDFLSDVKVLRRKLADRSSSEFILKNKDPKNIPFDSLYKYMKDLWIVIEENKDIDIPN